MKNLIQTETFEIGQYAYTYWVSPDYETIEVFYRVVGIAENQVLLQELKNDAPIEQYTITDLDGYQGAWTHNKALFITPHNLLSQFDNKTRHAIYTH